MTEVEEVSLSGYHKNKKNTESLLTHFSSQPFLSKSSLALSYERRVWISFGSILTTGAILNGRVINAQHIGRVCKKETDP